MLLVEDFDNGMMDFPDIAAASSLDRILFFGPNNIMFSNCFAQQRS